VIGANVLRELAEARAARVANLAYEVHLDLSAGRNRPIKGSIAASFELAWPEGPLQFDFTPPLDHLDQVVVNGDAAHVDAGSGEGRVLIASGNLRRGGNRVEFRFRAGAEAIHAQDDLLYSLFVPARASTVFPCFDQPDLKARWTLTLAVPRGWTAISNGEETGRQATTDADIVRFEQTARLPPYLFAFAAGRFQVDAAERHGRRIRMFHRESDLTRAHENRDALMDLHAHALSWLEEYTGIAYPFGKLDFVVIPAFQFSGMEHPGAVFYNADSVLLERSATHAQQLARANVVAHEVAHMWFGNLVTMTWFGDVWLKEVFAGFLADKIVNPVFPALQHDLRFLWEHYPAAYDVDRTRGSHPIRQRLDNLRDAGSLYGPIIYQKAPIVMRHLEDRLGSNVLKRGLREYLAKYAMHSAAWPDLQEILSSHGDAPLEPWSRAWIERPGRPAIEVDLSTANQRIERLRLRQTGTGEEPWPQRVELLLGYAQEIRHVRAEIVTGETSIHEAIGWPVPVWILPAGSRLAYGRFDPDRRTLDFLITSLSTLPDPLVRGVGLLTLWEAMLEKRAPVADVWAQLLTTVGAETDPLNGQQLFKYVSALFWRIFSPAAREASATALERGLRDGLARSGGAPAKAAWFAALRSLAVTSDTLEWLHRVWCRDTVVSGLALGEQDEIDLAVDVAMRAGPLAQDVIPRQLARIESPDRRARLEFLSPALSSEPGVRGRFLEELRSRPSRVPEAWVLESLRALFHPWHVPSGRQVVEALAAVKGVHDTGDIFFARRWADAALAGCQSPASVEDVRQFLDDLPAAYPARLRLMLLASADLALRQLGADR